jgi:hypothetical protein
LQWANFFDLQLPSVLWWSVHVRVKYIYFKVQDFAHLENIGQRTRLDQEISTQEFFQEAFSGNKIASHANHERKHEELAGETQVT